MRVITFASGSRGNCALVSSRGTHLLIDAGISMKRIKASLADAGLTPADISGVLVTHNHTDHISGLAMMAKHHKIPIYAPRTVANHISWSTSGVEDCLKPIPVGSAVGIGDVEITAFHTPHDTPESVGYRIESGDASFGFCTDIGHITDEVMSALMGVDAAVIEANHDEQMLRYGPYPFHVKRRILSDVGHLSNECCGALAASLAGGGAQYITLGHLSAENNNPNLAIEAVHQALERSERRARVYVAPAAEMLELDFIRSGHICSE